MTSTIFNSKFQYEALKIDNEYRLPRELKGTLLRKEMNRRRLLTRISKWSRSQPVYPLTSGLTNRVVSGHIRQALELCGDRLGGRAAEQMKQQEHLCHLRLPMKTSIFRRMPMRRQGRKTRLVFEELLTLQLGLLSDEGPCIGKKLPS